MNLVIKSDLLFYKINLIFLSNRKNSDPKRSLEAGNQDFKRLSSDTIVLTNRE